MNILFNSLSQGLLWAVMAIGVYITYRILDIADLTAEGSFTLGAAVTCKLILEGFDPFTATIAAMFAGMAAGFITGILHTKFKIPALLSGILTMTALWSVNLRVMAKSNISLLDENSIIKMIDTGLKNSPLNSALAALDISTKTCSAIIAGLALTIIVIFFLWWFFNTEIGYALRATGNNTQMIRALGVNTNFTIILGVIIGNGLIALSASLVAQYNGFADISMGAGTIVIGLASVIIGEVVFSDRSSFKTLISVMLGSILYRLIIAIVLELGLQPDDLKLISSVLLIIALCIPTLRQKYLLPIFKSLTKGKANKNA